MDTRHQDSSRQRQTNLLYHRGTIQLQGLKDMYAAAKESWEAQRMQLETTIAQLEARMDIVTTMTTQRNQRDDNYDHDYNYDHDVEYSQERRHHQQQQQHYRAPDQHRERLLPAHRPKEEPAPNDDILDCRPPQHKGKKDGLPRPIQILLLHHMEGPNTRHMKCQAICNLRPDLYGMPGSKRRRAVQNKIQWFKKLKTGDPAEYWKMVPDHTTFDEHKTKGTAAASHDEERYLDIQMNMKPAPMKRKSAVVAKIKSKVAKRKIDELEDGDEEIEEDTIMAEQQAEKKATCSAEMQKRLDSESSDDEDPDLDSKPPAAKRKSDELDNSNDNELEEDVMVKQQAEKKAARSAEMQKRLDSDSSSDDEKEDLDSKPPAAKRKSGELEESDDEPEDGDDELKDGNDELEEAITAEQQALDKFARVKERRKEVGKLNKNGHSPSSDNEEVDLDSEAVTKKKSGELKDSDDELEDATTGKQPAKKVDIGSKNPFWRKFRGR
jgi:hypothetical protein